MKAIFAEDKKPAASLGGDRQRVPERGSEIGARAMCEGSVRDLSNTSISVSHRKVNERRLTQ